MKRTSASVDPVGRVFVGKSKVVRVINPEAKDETMRIIDSGVLVCLVENKLFPQTYVKKYKDKLFLVHEKIKYHSRPAEWTYSIARDVTLAMLDVDAILRRYGYTLKDFHFENILLDRSKPKMVDFGSIVRDEKKSICESYFSEFLKYCYTPLWLWSRGKEYFALRIFSDTVHESRFFGVDYPYSIPMYVKVLLLFCRVARKVNKITGLRVVLFRNEPAISVKLIQSLKFQPKSTLWEGYHLELKQAHDMAHMGRFLKLVEIIQALNPGTMLDLAGNSGFFSMLCAKNIKSLRNIYCSDCDINAIEKLYDVLKSSSDSSYEIITPVLLNMTYPNPTIFDEMFDRLKSELVCALAVTHHLLLTQHIDCDYILCQIKKYAEKYVIIEFMPLGLYDGENNVEVPDWYTKDWFLDKFKKHFSLLREYELGANRIAFVGRV